MSRTKIVATIGPATSSEKRIRKLLKAGMDVARLNFSHGNRESITELATRLRKVADEMETPLTILGDLQGPKLRLGMLKEEPLSLSYGDRVTLAVNPTSDDELPFPHGELYEAIKPGARLVFGDGEVEFVVDQNDGDKLQCSVTLEGVLGSRKGVNMPGTSLPISSITPKDIEDLETSCMLDLDYVALSFVRAAKDVTDLRDLMATFDCSIPIIAKIEQSEAIEVLDEILEVSDGMMVARGDLGIDLPSYEIPFLQKRIIRACNDVGKPVITATQMLQSMVEHPIPTRAEATDVANAILDGTDAVMLSAETASGKYPVKAVKMMRNIAKIAEENFPYDEWDMRRREMLFATGNVGNAISSVSCGLARLIDAKAIVTTTMSGLTARHVARYRPKQDIVALSPKEQTRRRLGLVWGIRTLAVKHHGSTDDMVAQTSKTVAQNSAYELGDQIVITGGVPFGKTGLTNMLQVHILDEKDFTG